MDLLLDSDRLTAVAACEWAIRAGKASAADVRRVLAAAVRVPRVRRARAWCDLVDPRSESPLETAIRLVLLDAGLPAPEPQVSIVDRRGREIYRIDLGYRERRLGIEADGRTVHELPQAVFRDRSRQNALVQRGWVLLRFTWYDAVQRPAYVVRTVSQALARS
ncbi:MAG TPA: DUF559 domain-containing protein [Mycobacteriales bacterium]|nr:DUF559 domain-containing protein [Mycobacteriales bacterium]